MYGRVRLHQVWMRFFSVARACLTHCMYKRLDSILWEDAMGFCSCPYKSACWCVLRVVFDIAGRNASKATAADGQPIMLVWVRPPVVLYL